VRWNQRDYNANVEMEEKVEEGKQMFAVNKSFSRLFQTLLSAKKYCTCGLKM